MASTLKTARWTVLVFVLGRPVFERTAHAVEMHPPYADDNIIAHQLGRVRYSMIECSPNKRSVKVEIELYNSWVKRIRTIYRFAVLEAARKALLFAWSRCPRTPENYLVDYTNIVSERGIEYIAGAFIPVYDQRLKKDIYQWASFDDYTEHNLFRGIVSFIISCLIIFGILYVFVWVIRRWKMFVRWYFLLTPHPATKMVHSAVNSGAELDSEAFKQALQSVPGGRIKKEVREEQAAELAALARQNTAELRRKADELKQRLQEEAAFRAANRDLQDAAIEQQLAKVADILAKYEELLKRSGRK